MSLSFFFKLLIFALIFSSCKNSYPGNEILNVSITLLSSNVNIRASSTETFSKTKIEIISRNNFGLSFVTIVM